MSMCAKCIVKGSVQGVGYRQSALRMADAFGVTGWVRNLPNGDVELFACGEANDVERLKAWLWQGPMHANVTDVVCESVAYEEHAEFLVVI